MQQAPISRAPVVVVIVFAVVAVTLVLIGMQRPGEAPPDIEISRAGSANAPRDVTVIMRDYRFDPTPVVLVPGETVRFTIFNAGLEIHDFVIGDAEVQAAWHRADAAAIPPNLLATAPPASVPPDTGGLRVLLTSGERATVEYEVPSDEDLAILCHIPGHIEKGMVGAVDLRDITISP
ncbi:MAG TPA: hypothetical protein VK987_06925 [Anaerolineae bacterium]|nr:hypothetical protein [Anaerolineae bacterium]